MASGREPWHVAWKFGKWQHDMGRTMKRKIVNEILPVV